MANYLIAGTGPVAVQLACLFGQNTHNTIDMVARCRTSTRARTFYEAYHTTHHLKVSVQNEVHAQLAGSYTLHALYANYQDVKDPYDTLVLACPCDAYLTVLHQLPPKVLRTLKHIILVSPTLGSHKIVQNWMQSLNDNVEIIVFSTYLGDTRHVDSSHPTHVMTTGIKTHLYISSTHHASQYLKEVMGQFQAVSIPLTLASTPFQAESRNSSLYVHPPLLMNDFSLKAIFEGMTHPVYVYKLFPEGPITMTLIHEMRVMWQEMNAILSKLNVPTINLLKFMVTENYPVRPETLDEKDVQRFEVLPAIHQEYLLYVRYTAILIDPFSKPDKAGRYFDFSAVPYKSLFQNEAGEVQIPRMPSEDYYRLKVIQQLGHSLHQATPMIDTLLRRYETYLIDYMTSHPHYHYTNQFQLDAFEEDITSLIAAMETSRI